MAGSPVPALYHGRARGRQPRTPAARADHRRRHRSRPSRRRGDTGKGKRGPDIVAPGVSLVSLRAPGSFIDQTQKHGRRRRPVLQGQWHLAVGGCRLRRRGADAVQRPQLTPRPGPRRAAAHGAQPPRASSDDAQGDRRHSTSPPRRTWPIGCDRDGPRARATRTARGATHVGPATTSTGQARQRRRLLERRQVERRDLGRRDVGRRHLGLDGWDGATWAGATWAGATWAGRPGPAPPGPERPGPTRTGQAQGGSEHEHD